MRSQIPPMPVDFMSRVSPGLEGIPVDGEGRKTRPHVQAGGVGVTQRQTSWPSRGRLEFGASQALELYFARKGRPSINNLFSIPLLSKDNVDPKTLLKPEACEYPISCIEAIDWNPPDSSLDLRMINDQSLHSS